MALKPQSSKAWIVQVGGLAQTYFSKLTAPKVQFENFKYTDPEKRKILTHVGLTEEQPVTLSKLFDPATDQPIIDFCQKAKRGELQPFVVTAQPVKIDVKGSAIAGAKTLTLTNCQVLSITYPGADLESNNPTMLEIELIPEETDFA